MGTPFHTNRSVKGARIGLVSIITLAVLAFASWSTHVIWVIRALTSDDGATFGQIALGAIGAFMPPLGMIHGFMIWFGAGF